jgi:hypothetical protein
MASEDQERKAQRGGYEVSDPPAEMAERQAREKAMGAVGTVAGFTAAGVPMSVEMGPDGVAHHAPAYADLTDGTSTTKTELLPP